MNMLRRNFCLAPVILLSEPALALASPSPGTHPTVSGTKSRLDTVLGCAKSSHKAPSPEEHAKNLKLYRAIREAQQKEPIPGWMQGGKAQHIQELRSVRTPRTPRAFTFSDTQGFLEDGRLVQIVPDLGNLQIGDTL
jgi:hypothetical protein